jgi:hypothetical protein
MLGLDLDAIVKLLTRQTKALETIAELLEDIVARQEAKEYDDDGI